MMMTTTARRLHILYYVYRFDITRFALSIIMVWNQHHIAGASLSVYYIAFESVCWYIQ